MPTPQNGQRHSNDDKQLTNCLSVFGHFVGLVLKGLSREGNGISEWVKF